MSEQDLSNRNISGRIRPPLEGEVLTSRDLARRQELNETFLPFAERQLRKLAREIENNPRKFRIQSPIEGEAKIVDRRSQPPPPASRK